MNAVGYIRVSTDKQVKEGISIDNQAERIKDFCEKEGLELVDIIFDEGISGGKNKSRPGFVKLLNMIQSRKMEILVLYSLERLSRDMLTLLSLERYLNEYDIALYTVEGRVDTSTMDGWMSFAMKAFMSEMERRQVKYRTKRAMEHLKNNGKVAGEIPYGYKRVNDELVRVEEEQAVIKQANALYEKGFNLSQIARKLTKMGKLTRNGKPWTAQQVKRLLNGYTRVQRRRSNLGETIKDFILSMD